MAKTDGVARIIALAALGKDGGGSTGGTTNYLELANKPKINDVELTGNKTLEDLGINIPDLENYYTKEEIDNTFPTTEAVNETFEASWKETKEYIDSASNPLYTFDTDELYSVTEGELFETGKLVLKDIINKKPFSIMVRRAEYYGNSADYRAVFAGNVIKGIESSTTSYIITVLCSTPMIESRPFYPVIPVRITLEYDQSTKELQKVTFQSDRQHNFFLSTANTKSYTPTSDYNPATKKYVDDELSTKIGNEQLVFAKTFNGKDNENYAKLFYQSGCTDSEVCSYFSDILTKMYTNPQATYYNQISGILLLTLPNVNNGFCGIFEYYSPTRKFYSVNTEYDRSIVYEIEWSGEVDDEEKKITVSNVKINADLIKTDMPTDNQHVANKKYVDDNIKTYTAGDNITISDDNVISANVSGGTDSNAVYTYYAPYSDEDWFTEENVANILQTVKDKGYSNFELCTLNGSHYALRKGGNLQALTTTEEYYELEYLQNDLKNYVYYTFATHLDDNNKIVVGGLDTQTYTAQEMVEAYLPETLEKLSGYDGAKNHLILQANAGNLEWDSLLDGGTFSSDIN